MSFLGEISQRLKTDVGEIVRAAHDPVFARQLTERNFERDKREEIREADARKLQEQRIFDEQQRQLKLKSAAQIKLLDAALQNGRGTGDFTELFNMTQSENILPEVRDIAIAAYESDPQRSYDSLVKEQEIQNRVRSLDQTDRRLLLQEEQFESDEARFAKEFALKQAKFDYEQAVEVIRENQDVTNRQALIDSIRATNSGIWDDAEKDRIIAGMTGVSSKQALQVYEMAWDMYNQKLNRIDQNQRAKDKAAAADRRAAANAPLPTGATKNDKTLARTAIVNDIGEEQFKELPDDEENNQQEAFVVAVAEEARKLARNNRGTTPADWMQQALATVKARGFTRTEGTLGSFLSGGDFSDASEFRVVPEVPTPTQIKRFNPQTGKLEVVNQ